MTKPTQNYTPQEILDAIKVHELVGVDAQVAMTQEQWGDWSMQQFQESGALPEFPSTGTLTPRGVYQDHILPALRKLVVATVLEQKAPFMESDLAGCKTDLGTELHKLLAYYPHFNEQSRALVKGFADEYGTEHRDFKQVCAFFDAKAEDIAEKIANKVRVLDLEASKGRPRG